jgi:2-octaprenyl-6-methoxyphenol hydroxylase
MTQRAWRIAVIGAGPVGLALALHARSLLPQAQVTVFDARPADRDVAADPRTLALARGSVMFLERLGVWPRVAADAAMPIRRVHVSQHAPAWPPLPGIGARPAVWIDAAEQGVPHLGAVLTYGALLAPLQAAWLEAAAAEPARLASRFGTPVRELKRVADGVEVDAGIAETFDLAVVAEGGVFADQARKALVRDYGQTAWVGQVTLEPAADAPDESTAGTAFERFTAEGPLALLPLVPLPAREAGVQRAALVWCVASARDPVAALDDAQRIALINALLPAEAGRVAGITPLKHFALGLNAERTLVHERQVRIGNAAQTLHPVAGQGLNLGLRDAHQLVIALRDAHDVDAALGRVEWARAPDRWTMIAATDLLARAFTWTAPGLALLRGAGLAALQAAPPLKALLARQMMYGWR